jgi:type I restriction enzyme, S subunit
VNDNQTLVLRRGWTHTSIGEVRLSNVAQDGPTGDGSFVYVDIGSIDNKAKKVVEPKILNVHRAPSRARQRLEPNDVLVSMTRPNLNAVALVPASLGGAIGSTGFHVLRPHLIAPSWLFYLVQTNAFVEAMSRLVQGALYPAVRPKDIDSYTIPLAPVQEQHRIVAEIEKQFSRLDEAVASLKRIQAHLKRYRASVLTAACEGRLVSTEADLAQREGRSYETGEQLLAHILEERRTKWEADQLAKMEAAGKPPKDDKWRTKYQEPAVPDTEELPEPPKGWTWTSIEQVVRESLIGLDRGRDLQNAEGIGVPYVKMNNVTMDGRVTFEDVVYVPASSEERNRFALTEGDILFNTRNSRELVGKAGLVRHMLDGAIYNNNLMRLRVSNRIIPAFVCGQICSNGFRRRMELVKKATTNVAAVYAKDLFPLQLALPPLAEQRRIVAEVEHRLSLIDETWGFVEVNLRRSERLRQAILKRAFEGKLVPQDPNDEPASVLLESIRSERDIVRSGAVKEGKRPQSGNSRLEDVGGRGKMSSANRRSLIEVLKQVGSRLTPEQLFKQAGHTPASVESFYEELRSEIARGRIVQERPNSSEVFLRVSAI